MGLPADGSFRGMGGMSWNAVLGSNDVPRMRKVKGGTRNGSIGCPTT